MSSGKKLYAFLMVAYAIAALTVDSLSTMHSRWMVDWSRLYWSFRSGFEASTFILWLVIPCLLMGRDLDFRYFTFSRWKRSDYRLLVIFMALGALGICLIRFIPELNAYYPSDRFSSGRARWDYALHQTTWILSWLIGWEFLHRVFLLRYVQVLAGIAGLAAIPAIEFLFHLQKTLPEAFGALLLSVALTWWSYKRKNVLLPLITHFSIEISLIIYCIL